MTIKEVIKKIKAGHWLALAGVLLLLVIFFSAKSCKLYDESSILKGKYEAYRALAKEGVKQARIIIAEQEKKIKELEQEQIVSEENIEELEDEIIDLGLTTAELEAKRKELKDKDEIIANLDAQIAAWKEKFSLAQAVIGEKDKIIFSLTEKYEAQVKITSSYKLMYEDLVKVSSVADLRIKALEGDLRQARFWGNLSKASTVILAAIAVIAVIK